jgi:hypothetical protein
MPTLLSAVAERAPLPLGRALDEAPMSRRHMRFWLLAALGIIFDGFDFIIIGVANPLIAENFGTSALLLVIAGGCALAFVITWAFAIEPAGKSLDEVSGGEAAALAPRPVPP